MWPVNGYIPLRMTLLQSKDLHFIQVMLMYWFFSRKTWSCNKLNILRMLNSVYKKLNETKVFVIVYSFYLLFTTYLTSYVSQCVSYNIISNVIRVVSWGKRIVAPLRDLTIYKKSDTTYFILLFVSLF